MMEEMSVLSACDGMSEEEVLACLVADTEPTFMVPTKKAKLRENLLQIMEDDPLDKYQKENRRLQQTSLRLEQENDSLAHTLISSKISMRNALDKAEDRVDELTKDLLKAHHRLKATEEEKRGKEEEAAMMKQVFRRELEKMEQEIQRSCGIIADYKQICSQLTQRLDTRQAAHREQIDVLKSSMESCSRCRLVAESLTTHRSSASEEQTAPPPSVTGVREERREEREEELLRAQVGELEKELAQTKLQMVEAKCKIQELEHQKRELSHTLQEARNRWISKAFTSLRTSSSGSGLPGIHIHRDAAPGPGLHPASLPRLPTWSPKKLSWQPRQTRSGLTVSDTSKES